MDQLCFKKICHWFHLRCLVVFNWNDWSKAVITCGLFWCTWDNPSHPRVFLAFCVCAPVSWHSSSYDFSLSEYRQGQDRKKRLVFQQKHPETSTYPHPHYSARSTRGASHVDSLLPILPCYNPFSTWQLRQSDDAISLQNASNGFPPHSVRNSSSFFSTIKPHIIWSCPPHQPLCH